VHYVGVDLAWGQNKVTGLAIVDAAGQLPLRVKIFEAGCSGIH
jgi:predicted RNase H-like nuclease